MPVPTGVIPLYHWYAGVVPPLVGVAVKVTNVPAQTGLVFGAIATLAVKTGFTIMVTALDVAGDPVRQGVKFDVITTLITSPLTGI